MTTVTRSTDGHGRIQALGSSSYDRLVTFAAQTRNN